MTRGVVVGVNVDVNVVLIGLGGLLLLIGMLEHFKSRYFRFEKMPLWDRLISGALGVVFLSLGIQSGLGVSLVATIAIL